MSLVAYREMIEGLINGTLKSPQIYEESFYIKLRITGTGITERYKEDENGDVIFDEENKPVTYKIDRLEEDFLSNKFLESCIGIPVLIEHPDSKLLNGENYKNHVVGTIVAAYIKNYENAPEKVGKCLIDDIEPLPFPTKNIVPFIDVVHDRASVESFRGCTRGCRFCQAGMIYRPVRERKPETILALAEEQLKNTGHEELSLLSLSTSDHSCFEPLALELVKKCAEKHVNLSLPSLRLDSFSFNVLNEIQKYKKSGLTFAPEAGTQRLRNVINKSITEEDIYGAVRKAIELGWKQIKLYFMIGLPTETYEDLDGIAEIAKNILDINYEINGRKGGRFNVTVSVSNFVPKPHTPFQWFGQNTYEEFIEKHKYLSEKLRMKNVTFHYHDSPISVLEAVFARGDRKTGKLLVQAYKNGCVFDSWSEFFNMEGWEKAFKQTGLSKDFYATRYRTYDEVMPWDIIDSYLLTTRVQSCELVVATYTGLKVPKSAIRYEDGVPGVYVVLMDKMYFRTINVVYETEDFVVSSATADQSNPLKLYDTIIVEGVGLYNQKDV